MSNVEVKVLRGFGAEAARARALKRKWGRLWSEIGDRISALPEREQEILLEDFHTAIESRLAFFEKITGGQS